MSARESDLLPLLLGSFCILFQLVLMRWYSGTTHCITAGGFSWASRSHRVSTKVLEPNG